MGSGPLPLKKQVVTGFQRNTATDPLDPKDQMVY